MQLQALFITATTALNVWIVLDFGFDGLGKGIALFGLSGRLSGITSVLMILGASIVMAWQAKPAWRIQWQYAAFVAGLLFLSSLRWAGIDPASAGLWLHRSVVLLISAAMMTLLCSFGLRKVISSKSDWIIAGQRMTPFFGGLTILMLALVLGQEWMLYKDVIGTPLVTAEIVAVAVIVAAMLATCIAFAVRAEWDPLQLSLNGRQAYVYIAEVLAVLIGLHLRLTKPELFNFGIYQKLLDAADNGRGLCRSGPKRMVPPPKAARAEFTVTAHGPAVATAAGNWILVPGRSTVAFVANRPLSGRVVYNGCILRAVSLHAPLAGMRIACGVDRQPWTLGSTTSKRH